jgi:hypothetical protein
MKRLSFFLLLLLGAMGQAATYTVSSLSGPWDPLLNPTLDYGVHDQDAPTLISITAGHNVQISGATGIIAAGGPDFFDPAGPEGYPHTPWSPANDDPGSSGMLFPSVHSPNTWPTNLMTLMGSFADDAGIVIGEPFTIGTQTLDLTAPTGATKLQLGFNDDIFWDNLGSVSVNVEVLPEPSAVCLLVLGTSVILLRRRARRFHC